MNTAQIPDLAKNYAELTASELERVRQARLASRYRPSKSSLNSGRSKDYCYWLYLQRSNRIK